MINCYFICSTPRTGSTLLCSLLKSSKIAGKPESYFRKQDIEKYAANWEIRHKNFIQYINAAIQFEKTSNNIFSSRIMWGTMDELTNNIKLTDKTYFKTDLKLLEKYFGNIKFIYLKRDNYLEQAVSRLKAEQSDIWHYDKTIINPKDERLVYDGKRLKEFINEALEHNKLWVDWFIRNNITPYTITYENLIENQESECSKILKYLDISFDKEIIFTSPNKKMSDETSKEWIRRFKSEESF